MPLGISSIIYFLVQRTGFVILTVITNIWWFVDFIAFVRQEIRTYIGWVTTITAFAIEGAVAVMVTLTMELTT